MMASIRQQLTQRPVWWPAAATASVIVFFAVSMAVSGLQHALFMPDNPEVVGYLSESGTVPITKEGLMYDSFGMFVGIGIAKAVYSNLRGENLTDALATEGARLIKVALGVVAWTGSVLALLWLIGQGGVVGIIGVILSILFAVVCLTVVASLWETHTPPYPEARTERENE